MGKKTAGPLAVTVLVLCSAPVFGALLNPHQARGSINLRPYSSTALMGATVWYNRLYVSGQSASGGGPNTWCVDVADPNALAYLSGIGTGFKAYGHDVQDGKIYSASWGSGLRVFDASTPILSQLGETNPSSGAYWHIALWRDRAYVSDRLETRVKFLVFDISNPSSPQFLSEHNGLSRPNGLSARGSYVYLADSPYFTVINVSDDTNPTVVSRTYIGGLIHWAVLRGNYVYVFYDETLNVYDVSDPTTPEYVGGCGTSGGFHDGSPCVLGNYIFCPASGGCLYTVNISNPYNPFVVTTTNAYGYELTCAGNGRYVYVGNIAGDNEGWVHAIQAFDSDPDLTPPPTWSSFSLADASWDTEYMGDALPGLSSPAWAVAPGCIEGLGSVSGGILRVNDDSGSAKCSWVRNWDATNSHGATVLVRARCASWDLNGGSIGNLNNVTVEDGRYVEDLTILTDRIRANRAGVEYALDGTQWHTYRITTLGNQFRVYVDEAATPVLTSTLSSTTNRARIWFGSSSTVSLQDIYFDYVQCCSSGLFGPAGQTNDQTPDLAVNVSDFVHNDSVSGVDPTSALAYWSTDGGVTWSPPGGQAISCSGSSGDYAATLTASAVPFNQNSHTLNKIKFSIRDVVGNLAYSPVYNVRIDPNAGPRVTNVTSDKPNGSYKAGTLFNIQVSFNTNVTVIGTSRLLLETGTTDRYASYTGGSGTSVLNYAYTAQINDTSNDLDYASANALSIVSGSIRDVFGSDADLRLAAPGAAGSLGYNKNLVVDGVYPRVTNVTSDKADGVYKSGETIDVLLIFNEPVTVTGTPQLELETGAVDRKANYLFGSGSAALTFRYVVQSGDESADLDYKATNSLSLNGGTIKDGVGNVASLILPAPGAAGSLGSNKELVVIVADGRIADARSQGDGASVTLGDKVLYYKQGSVGYIEESDRTCGIRLEGTISASEGELVCLRGVMATTAGGERCIQVNLVTPHGSGSVDPLGVSNAGLRRSLMEGLYVACWGNVVDGSVTGDSYMLSDGSDSTGIKIITDGPPGVDDDDFVVVFGAAGYEGARVVHRK